MLGPSELFPLLQAMLLQTLGHVLQLLLQEEERLGARPTAGARQGPAKAKPLSPAVLPMHCQVSHVRDEGEGEAQGRQHRQ